MQRLKDKIEKWFGEGIEYKWVHFNTIHSIDENYLRIQIKKTGHWNALSINDLYSPECSFLKSLDFIQLKTFTVVVDTLCTEYRKKHSTLDYHRMQLSLLSDEQKILYIINNTK